MSEAMIIEALVQGDMDDLLRGRGGFAVHNPYLDTPTEPVQVFAGILGHYGGSPAVMQDLLKEVQRMADEPDYAWFAPYYLFDIIIHADKFGPALDLQAYVDTVLALVRKHEAYLRGLKRWAGAQDPDGCWGIVDRLVLQLKKYHENDRLKVNW